VGRRISQEDQLRVQRTWLMGQRTGRTALLLHFSAGNQPLESSPQTGTRVEGSICFYPGAHPLRALFRSPPATAGPLSELPPGGTIHVMLNEYARALARDPWLERWPAMLESVTPEVRVSPEGVVSCLVCDTDQRRLPLTLEQETAWQLISVAGGRAISLFGEWDGQHVTPLTVANDGRLFTVSAVNGKHALVRAA
jgi:hypothetical protein